MNTEENELNALGNQNDENFKQQSAQWRNMTEIDFQAKPVLTDYEKETTVYKGDVIPNWGAIAERMERDRS